MFHKIFPPLNGKRTDVVIIDGLPELSMSIILEVFRNPPEDEHAAYVFIADFLKRLLDDERDGLVDMVARLNKTIQETYIDGLVDSGHAVQQLNESAIVIQRRWRSYKSRAATAPRSGGDTSREEAEGKTKDRVRTTETTAENVTETLNGYGGIPTKSTDHAATLIQRAWRRHFDVVRTWKAPDLLSSVRLANERRDECEYENESDDAERVNVVRKDKRDYVPPIPDFIRDTISNSSTADGRSRSSFEDEYGGEGDEDNDYDDDDDDDDDNSEDLV